MDYVEMIKDPELVLGFQELISDSDPVVVKRTVRVFTSVYHHTLRLLSTGELEEETLLKSWSAVKGVVDRLLAMVKRCDNEGILIHLLRFLEAAVITHLLYDLSAFPFVFERGREVVKTGLKALKDLVTTPYVGGSTFIVGVRAIISIACLRPDLWEPVTDLLKKQLVSLPPTLFDHNVRSLNKTLQRNLFRLLRRAETPELKEKLIEMMVGVGVPRKIIMPWAPPPVEVRKRGSPGPSYDSVSFPPPADKKPRLEADDDTESRGSNTPEVPSDPRLAPPQDPRKVCQPNTQPPPNRFPVQKIDNANLMFLKSLIPTGNGQEPDQQEGRALPFEKEFFKKLDLECVGRLVIENIGKLPDREPVGFSEDFKNQSKVADDVDAMRKTLATLLARYLEEHNIKNLVFDPPSKPNSPPVFPIGTAVGGDSLKVRPVETSKSDGSNTSSTASTPSSTPPLADTDMRQVYSHSAGAMGDVDMRVVDPRLATRDPRIIKDPRIRKEVTDPRLSSHVEPRGTGSRTDPRLGTGIRTTVESKPRQDPRLTNSQTKKPSTEPRKTRWDPRTPPLDNPVTSIPSTSAAQLSRPEDSLETVTFKPNDPRINRSVSQGQGLLPHPDPRTFQREAMDPRMQIQSQCGDALQIHQNFNAQPQFSFAQMNTINQFNNPFVGRLALSHNSMPPPILSGSTFPWQNNLTRNHQPQILVAQTLTSVQPGMLPPSAVLNL